MAVPSAPYAKCRLISQDHGPSARMSVHCIGHLEEHGQRREKVSEATSLTWYKYRYLWAQESESQ